MVDIHIHHFLRFLFKKIQSMKNFKHILILITTIQGSLIASDSLSLKTSYKRNQTLDLSLSTAGNQSAGAFSWTKLHNVTKNKKFKIGYGVRLTSFIGKDLDYVTAPARLTSNQTGPQVLFSPIFEENYDTVRFSTIQLNALNLNVHLQYTFKSKFDVGFNIDAVGFTFGSKRTGKYFSKGSPENSTSQNASVTPLNLLLISDNDIGTLNSELYVRYWIHPKWAIKAGAAFLFTEYTTNNKLRLDNDRFRNKSLQAMIGVSFKPFKQ